MTAHTIKFSEEEWKKLKEKAEEMARAAGVPVSVAAFVKKLIAKKVKD